MIAVMLPRVRPRTPLLVWVGLLVLSVALPPLALVLSLAGLLWRRPGREWLAWLTVLAWSAATTWLWLDIMANRPS